MKLLVLIFAVVAFLSPTLADAAAPTLFEQVGLVPPAPGPHPDLDVLLRRFWRDYYQTDGTLGFTLDQVKVGRIDLNGDDVAELVVMIDRPAWRARDGKPFVVATWRDGEWAAVGWGWADEESLWTTPEVIDGWRSLDAGRYIMRWGGTEYRRDPKG